MRRRSCVFGGSNSTSERQPSHPGQQVQLGNAKGLEHVPHGQHGLSMRRAQGRGLLHAKPPRSPIQAQPPARSRSAGLVFGQAAKKWLVRTTMPLYARQALTFPSFVGVIATAAGQHHHRVAPVLCLKPRRTPMTAPVAPKDAVEVLHAKAGGRMARGGSG